jgi:tRNA(Ile)-lysidine synthase
VNAAANPGVRLQDIPPRCARLCLRVERFLREELGLDLAGKSLLLGLSGGADSTALLHILRLLQPRLGFSTLLAAHLDHGLRSESGQDATQVSELCASLRIPLLTERAAVRALATERRCGLEEAGRIARYGFFARVMSERGTDRLLLAHTLDDLAEDALMRLIRGAGWPALAGMEGVDAARRLARPLLLTPKAELLRFLHALGLTWCEDASNAELDCLRNRVRHEMLPLLLRENPAYLDAVAQRWRLGRIDADFWDERLARCAPEDPSFLPNASISVTDQALRLRLYKAHLEALGPGQALVESLLRLDRAWKRGEGGKTLQFPGDKRCRVTREGLAFFVAERK